MRVFHEDEDCFAPFVDRDAAPVEAGGDDIDFRTPTMAPSSLRRTRYRSRPQLATTVPSVLTTTFGNRSESNNCLVCNPGGGMRFSPSSNVGVVAV